MLEQRGKSLCGGRKKGALRWAIQLEFNLECSSLFFFHSFFFFLPVGCGRQGVNMPRMTMPQQLQQRQHQLQHQQQQQQHQQLATGNQFRSVFQHCCRFLCAHARLGVCNERPIYIYIYIYIPSRSAQSFGGLFFLLFFRRGESRSDHTAML